MPTPAIPVVAQEKIVERARNWRKTEKEAIAAPEDAKTEANRAHYRAKQQLREAVDLSEVQS